MTRIALVLVSLTVAAACSSPPEPSTEAGTQTTVAFLRAVGSSSSEGQDILLGELRDAGFTAGANLEVLGEDPELAYPDPVEAQKVVEGWVDDGVDLIFALSSSGAMVAAEAAPDIPVLFISNDPSATGLVTNEVQPEGNLTGVTFRVPADRTLSIARRALSRLEKVGLVYPSEDPAAQPHAAAVEAAARSLGLKLVTANFTDETDAAQAVDDLVAEGVDAIFISNSPTAIRALEPIQAAADKAGVPTIANTAVATGAIVVLSPDSAELNRQLGLQAARLLSGSAVADVPVEDPREFQLILNAAGARKLSIQIPKAVLREAELVLQ
ncbi:MAG: putative tryptophan/tyrosine transport system substrate-binding protein [Actinomycetota bacterium]|jgi:putative ABC transport system substrate-binding protein|nr:putative tryptophan/tyrosine transport system substrate-binding protein [Actinomycetota bacterium]